MLSVVAQAPLAEDVGEKHLYVSVHMLHCPFEPRNIMHFDHMQSVWVLIDLVGEMIVY